MDYGKKRLVLDVKKRSSMEYKSPEKILITPEEEGVLKLFIAEMTAQVLNGELESKVCPLVVTQSVNEHLNAGKRQSLSWKELGRLNFFDTQGEICAKKLESADQKIDLYRCQEKTIEMDLGRINNSFAPGAALEFIQQTLGGLSTKEKVKWDADYFYLGCVLNEQFSSFLQHGEIGKTVSFEQITLPLLQQHLNSIVQTAKASSQGQNIHDKCKEVSKQLYQNALKQMDRNITKRIEDHIAQCEYELSQELNAYQLVECKSDFKPEQKQEGENGAQIKRKNAYKKIYIYFHSKTAGVSYWWQRNSEVYHGKLDASGFKNISSLSKADKEQLVSSILEQVSQSLDKNMSWYLKRYINLKKPIEYWKVKLRDYKKALPNSEEKASPWQERHKKLLIVGGGILVASPAALALAGELAHKRPDQFLLASGNINIEGIHFASINYITVLLAFMAACLVYKAVDELAKYSAKKCAAPKEIPSFTPASNAVSSKAITQASENALGAIPRLEDIPKDKEIKSSAPIGGKVSTNHSNRNLLISLGLTGGATLGMGASKYLGREFPGLGGDLTVGDLMITTMVVQTLFLLINLVAKWQESTQTSSNKNEKYYESPTI